MLRKIYIKFLFFLYSMRKPLSSLVLALIVFILLYSAFNNGFVNSILINKANNDSLNKNYKNAIKTYTMAYMYYDLNHISYQNKKMYLDLPYKISMCYLAEGDRQKALNVMLRSLSLIQTKFGIYSREHAYFLRKYLINYFLQSNNITLAKNGFTNLYLIYKKIGCSNDEKVDLIRLTGDFYYYQKDYDDAIANYLEAYDLISGQEYIDYEIFASMVNKIFDYEIERQNTNYAVDLYKKSIVLIKSGGKENVDFLLGMLIKLGDFYISQGATTEAINYYEQVISIIKKLPQNDYYRQRAVTYLKTLKDLYTTTRQYQKANYVDSEIIKEQRFSFLF